MKGALHSDAHVAGAGSASSWGYSALRRLMKFSACVTPLFVTPLVCVHLRFHQGPETWANIKCGVRLRKLATETHGILRKVPLNEATSWAGCFEWHVRFKKGRMSLEDDEVRATCHQHNLQKCPRNCAAAQFMPTLLTPGRRVEVGKDLRQQASDEPTFMLRIITSDKNLVYGYKAQTKQQSWQWKRSPFPRQKMVPLVRNQEHAGAFSLTFSGLWICPWGSYCQRRVLLWRSEAQTNWTVFAKGFGLSNMTMHLSLSHASTQSQWSTLISCAVYAC